MESRLLRYVRKIDILAPEIKLNIGGESSAKTLLGGWLTILYGAAVVSLVGYIMKNYFRTDNPMAMSHTYTQSSVNEFDLAASSYLPVLIAYHDESRASVIPFAETSKFFSVLAFRRKMNAANSFEDSRLSTVECSQLSKAQARLFDYLQASPSTQQRFSTAICTLPDQPIPLRGQFLDDEYQSFVIEVKPCLEGSSCASVEEVSKITIQLINPVSSFNQSRQKNPQELSSVSNVQYFLNPDANQHYLYEFKKNVVMDYLGLLPTWQETSSFFDLHQSKYQSSYRKNSQTSCTAADPAACQSYLSIEYRSSRVMTTISRRYKSIVEAFGEMGGVNEVLYILFALAYFRYNNSVREERIMNKVFGFFNEIEHKERKQTHPVMGQKTTDKVASKTCGQQIAEFFRNCFGPWIVCRCKRKDFDEVYKEEVMDCAKRNIASHMDVFNIIREMNNLKVICNFIFKSHHIKLVPFLEFNIFRRKLIEKREITTKHKDILLNKARILNLQGSGPVEDEELPQENLLIENSAKLFSYEQALTDLERKVLRDSRHSGQMGIEELLNCFFYRTLLETDEFLQKKTQEAECAFKTEYNIADLNRDKSNSQSEKESAEKESEQSAIENLTGSPQTKANQTQDTSNKLPSPVARRTTLKNMLGMGMSFLRTSPMKKQTILKPIQIDSPMSLPKTKSTGETGTNFRLDASLKMPQPKRLDHSECPSPKEQPSLPESKSKALNRSEKEARCEKNEARNNSNDLGSLVNSVTDYQPQPMGKKLGGFLKKLHYQPKRY